PGTLGVGDDDRLTSLEDADDRVRGSEIDSDSLCHGGSLSSRATPAAVFGLGADGASRCVRPPARTPSVRQDRRETPPMHGADDNKVERGVVRIGGSGAPDAKGTLRFAATGGRPAGAAHGARTGSSGAAPRSHVDR